MIYNSINQIKEEFSIKSDNLDEIRDCLNDIRIKLHPDRSNGEFENESKREMYYNVNSAIDYLDKVKNNHSLVVVEKMTDLMKIVAELVPNSKNVTLESNLEAKISNSISMFRSKLFLPKISLTAITAIVTFIFLFPTQIKDNPVLSHFINPSNNIFLIIWIVLLFYSGLFWIMTYLNEERAKRKFIS